MGTGCRLDQRQETRAQRETLSTQDGQALCTSWMRDRQMPREREASRGVRVWAENDFCPAHVESEMHVGRAQDLTRRVRSRSTTPRSN